MIWYDMICWSIYHLKHPDVFYSIKGKNLFILSLFIMMHNQVGLRHIACDKPLIFFILRSQLDDLKVLKLGSCDCRREQREAAVGQRKLCCYQAARQAQKKYNWSLWHIIFFQVTLIWIFLTLETVTLSVLRQDWHCQVNLTETHCVPVCEVTTVTWSQCPHNLEKLFIIWILQLSLPLSFSLRVPSHQAEVKWTWIRLCLKLITFGLKK